MSENSIWDKPVSHGEILKKIWKNLDSGNECSGTSPLAVRLERARRTRNPMAYAVKFFLRFLYQTLSEIRKRAMIIHCSLFIIHCLPEK
ncbi:MAG: hypothetical protein ACR2HG_13615 [Pyrinomonadaceae bacterium]